MIQSETQEYVSAIEVELRRWLSSRKAVGRHYDLLAYHMGWVDESLSDTPGPTGKRFRPLLCLLCCQAVGGDWHDALPLAASIEFLHNFSLIHDDIEDHDETRHHRPSLWKLSGEPLAINAGDAMLALSGIAALSCPNPSVIALGLEETALALTEGQYLDMAFQSQAHVSPAEYFRMIGLKTGALITFSCESGALLGNGTVGQVEAVRRFGRNFGLAFQLFDDIRGIWGQSSETGKAEVKDIVNRKKSLPVLSALENTDSPHHHALAEYYSGRIDVDPVRVRDMLGESGIYEATTTVLQDRLELALAALCEGQLVEPCREAISRLALSLVGSPKVAK